MAKIQDWLAGRDIGQEEQMRIALVDLLREAESMNKDLIAIGRGRGDGWPQAIGLAREALRGQSLIIE